MRVCAADAGTQLPGAIGKLLTGIFALTRNPSTHSSLHLSLLLTLIAPSADDCFIFLSSLRTCFANGPIGLRSK